MMSCVFMMIPRVYDDERMTSRKELCWFYVRLQGGSVYLWRVLSFIIMIVKYGSSLESNLCQKQLGLRISDRIFNGLIIILAV